MAMPEPRSEIGIIETFADTRDIGLTINHENMDEEKVDAAIGQYERELGLTTTDALTRSPASLVDMVLSAFPELAGISSAATR